MVVCGLPAFVAAVGPCAVQGENIPHSAVDRRLAGDRIDQHIQRNATGDFRKIRRPGNGFISVTPQFQKDAHGPGFRQKRKVIALRFSPPRPVQSVQHS